MGLSRHRCGPLLLLLLFGLPLPAFAHVMLLESPSRLMFSGFASAVAVVADMDGDGVPEYLVGAYDHPWNKHDHQGRAFVFSGRNGALLFPLDDPVPQREAAFGCAVAGIDDVNSDGVPDLLIGAFGQAGSGQVFVFSGQGGQLLYTLQASTPQLGAGFGWSVAAVGDLTKDGVSEIVVGALAQDGEGRAFVFDGHKGKLLWALAPPPPLSNAAFGWSVAAAGDLNQDGTPDILVGAPYTTRGTNVVQGRVYALSGRDGSVLYALDDPHPDAGAAFGWRVATSGDLNKDGVPDIVVGAPYQSVGAHTAQGAAFVFSGADGHLLFPLQDPASESYAGFGFAVSEGADITQDGIPEILIGAPFQKVDQFHVQGEVFLFNGQNGHLLTTFDNPYPHQGSMFGSAFASPGDVNGDTIPDFVIGASGQHVKDQVTVGRVYIFLSQPQWQSSGRPLAMQGRSDSHSANALR